MDKIKLMNTDENKNSIDKDFTGKRRTGRRTGMVWDRAGDFLNVLKEKQQKIFSIIDENNFYKIIREWFILNYLNKTTGLKKEEKTVISWQPWFFMIGQMLLIFYLSQKAYLYLHPLFASWLEQGLSFFKLDQIYNFKFPDKNFFSQTSKYFLLFIIAYYGFFYFISQIPGLFSSVTACRRQEKIYFIKSYLLFKELYVFSIPEIELLILKQNFITRIFNYGTLVLQKKSGDKIIIRLIKKASLFMRSISNIYDA